MFDTNKDNEDIRQIQRKIIILKREIAQLKFKNSLLFKLLNLVNLFIFITYVQFLISYVFDFQFKDIPNNYIQFNAYPYQSEKVKLYTIKFKYNNYFFRVKINKELDQTIMYSDAIISEDVFFHIPQKLKLKNFNSHWFLINESLGILTICAIIVFVQIIAYAYKQNEQFYSLFSISFLSILSFIGISIFSLHIHNFI